MKAGEVHVKVTADTSEAEEALGRLGQIWEPVPRWVPVTTLLGVAFIIGWLLASVR